MHAIQRAFRAGGTGACSSIVRTTARNRVTAGSVPLAHHSFCPIKISFISGFAPYSASHQEKRERVIFCILFYAETGSPVACAMTCA